MNIDGDGELVLAFNGDVMLGRLVNEMIRHMGTVWQGVHSSMNERRSQFSNVHETASASCKNAI
jgi:hypothetical protein